MKHWTKIAGATICLVAASVSPAFAEGTVETLPAPTGEVISAREMTIRGVLTYMDLEGGFYSVSGYMLRGEPSLFEPLLGKVVLVTGAPFDGMSIQMVKSLTVSNIEVDPDQSIPNESIIPIMAPDAAGLKAVEPARSTPSSIVIDGQEISFDQGPVVSENTLMVPLRFLVEAAGGEVEWDGDRRQVTVRMPDQVVLLEIGSSSAEVVHGGQGATEVHMAKPPVLAGDRTLVSADTLSNVFGFMERQTSESQDAQASVMNLTVPSSAPAVELKSVLSGTVKQVEDGDKVRILVEGAAMANGEPNLTWITVSAETKVFIEENGDRTEGQASDLAAGQAVEAEVGPVAMSYPALAGASSITIKK